MMSESTTRYGSEESQPTVSLVRCEGYDARTVRDAVERALAFFPSLSQIAGPGRKVLLKPNLLSCHDPVERAINTHPEFVRAVAEFFAERGCEILIGDSCGSLAPGSTATAIAATGLDKVAAEVGAQIVNFDKAPCIEVDVPNPRVLKRVRIPSVIHGVDAFITLPKLKTHALTLLTGAVKNQLGLVPGRGKKDIHIMAPKPFALAQALLDIHAVARPHMAVMDAIVGMEGNGPSAGTARSIGLVAASDDCVALDTVASAIIGYKRDEIATCRLARGYGLGESRLDRIKMAGVPLDEVRTPDFKKPSMRAAGPLVNMIPAALFRWLFNSAGTAFPRIEEGQCTLCGECMTNCPAGALSIVNGKMTSDDSLCISCYCCTEVCPQSAIGLQRPLAGRVAHAVKRLVRRDGAP